MRYVTPFLLSLTLTSCTLTLKVNRTAMSTNGEFGVTIAPLIKVEREDIITDVQQHHKQKFFGVTPVPGQEKTTVKETKTETITNKDTTSSAS